MIKLEKIREFAQRGAVDGLTVLILIKIILKQKAALDRYESMNGKYGTAGRTRTEVEALVGEL